LKEIVHTANVLFLLRFEMWFSRHRCTMLQTVWWQMLHIVSTRSGKENAIFNYCKEKPSYISKISLELIR